MNATVISTRVNNMGANVGIRTFSFPRRDTLHSRITGQVLNRPIQGMRQIIIFVDFRNFKRITSSQCDIMNTEKNPCTNPCIFLRITELMATLEILPYPSTRNSDFLSSSGYLVCFPSFCSKKYVHENLILLISAVFYEIFGFSHY